ncbi:hypothetical protein Syn7502_01734 [Synechococcus sp. PCC 7502]|uniref:hypothetical protein n=1 Tax=Synechococcus sp. PCC 7502 TaxID=1173263 RepID=UPI00029FD099|nr:hypothetical protein [Synechococcus sp. PCC 7502]AFY73781.1 hypothetical protein Syn7502_01734 [Synechococcus sp. PCC 7502]
MFNLIFNPLKIDNQLAKENQESPSNQVSKSLALNLPLHLSVQKIKAAILLGLGYMLSPLCWWNDIVFNLPIAYGFGYICSLFSPQLLLPGTFVGYWLSNLVGILLMQWGAIAAFQNKAQQNQERNLKRELWMGLLSSTAYTLVILALVQCKFIDLTTLLPVKG